MCLGSSGNSEFPSGLHGRLFVFQQDCPWFHEREDSTIQIIIVKDRNQLGDYVADCAAQLLRQTLNSNAMARLVVATGSSQFEVLERLCDQPDVDWKKVEGYHLDEYLGLSSEHPASFCRYLRTRFVERVPLASFHYLDGMIAAEELIKRSNEALAGKRVDLLLCGIGENGHLAFNDPPANFEALDPYLIVDLDEACRRQQVGEGWFETLEQVPKRAISMTIQQILRAKAILCSVPDLRKAEAVKNSVDGPLTPWVPASILRQHPNVQLILDLQSSSLLSPETLQRCINL